MDELELVEQIKNDMKIACQNMISKIDTMGTTETFEKTWIDTMIQNIGFKKFVNYTLDRNDLGCANLLYTYYKKRLHRLGKKYYLIESLAIMHALGGDNEFR